MCIRDSLCTYGICEQHARMSLINTVIAQGLGAKRMIVDNGIGYVITVIVLFLAGAAYTPFLKTAIMIIACHPFYQCEFDRCYTFITQKFALAVFLSSSIVVVLGIGFPTVLFVLLYRRKRMLDTFFFGDAYAGRYEEVDGDTATKSVTDEQAAAPKSLLQRIAGRRVKLVEWARFISTDSSGISQQYNQGFYHWIYIAGLFIVFKILVVIPAVALETKSFEQRLGCGVVEIFIAVFIFMTRCQTSPILLLTLRAASVHQLLVLGLQNIDLVARNDINESIANYLIAVTLIYVLFSVVVFVATVILPTIAARRQHVGVLKFLNKHGFDYSKAISLWLEPFEATDINSRVENGSVTKEPSDFFDPNSDVPRERRKTVTSVASVSTTGVAPVRRRQSTIFDFTVDVKSEEDGSVPAAPQDAEHPESSPCLLYTSDAADDLLCVDLGGRRIIKKKKKDNSTKRDQTQ
eukprot:TRINITY_DN1472_c0_g1_i3.p1 TRINITY_DN1472_c0_g1~~TRINITY_DN1472_c0_g1_i3.p1  ORF type:complete len:464 (+),score=180.38 TRINITY_DN1472_c0_g1_i3:152-1543(+)